MGFNSAFEGLNRVETQEANDALTITLIMLQIS